MVFLFYYKIFFSKFIFIWKFKKLNTNFFQFFFTFGCYCPINAAQLPNDFTFPTLSYYGRSELKNFLKCNLGKALLGRKKKSKKFKKDDFSYWLCSLIFDINHLSQQIYFFNFSIQFAAVIKLQKVLVCIINMTL